MHDLSGDVAPFGVILAGGRASRMGGGDKALLDLAGRPLLAHVIARLAPQVGALALNANGDAARFSDWGLPVIADSVGGYPGPLAGVLAGMDWAAARGASHIVTAAADTPFFPRDLAARLIAAARAEGTPLAMAATPERGGLARQPTFGLWPVALREDLRAALAGGLRKVVQWTEPLGCARAVFETGARNPFFNVNTPADLAEAARIAGARQKVFGVVGWKNSGKTTLMEKLVAQITARGFSVSTVKHAHHAFDVDRPGKDSHRHRQAGAREVLLVSANRWALMHELRDAPEPPLETLLERLAPVDLVLIEGYKRDPHPKIEAHRAATGKSLIAPGDPTVRAVASDEPAPGDVPVFGLDDARGIADFILAETGLEARR